MRKIIGRKEILLVVFSIAFALLTVECCLRIFVTSLFVNENEDGNQYRFYKYDDDLGWANQPLRDGLLVKDEFEHGVFINQDGARDAEFKKPEDNLDILMLGDSFVWGIGSEYGERFTEFLEKSKLINEVRNFGVTGYGQVQQLLQIRNKSVSLDGIDHVILSICLANDLLDNIYPRRYGYLKPYASLGNDKKLLLHKTPTGINKEFGNDLGNQGGWKVKNFGVVKLIKKVLLKFNNQKSNQIDYNEIYSEYKTLPDDIKSKIDETYLIFEELLKEISKEVKSKEIKFSVLIVPTQYEYDLRGVTCINEVRNRVVKILQRNSILFLDPTFYLEKSDFWPSDGHWKKSGHLKISQLLEKHLHYSY